MSTSTTLTDRVRALCGEAAGLVRDLSAREAIESVRARLDEPLRVAFAGRVKAGKSTLLNAIVGERLAPTDASDCTRFVTWYRWGLSYTVEAHLRDGTTRAVPFSREGGALEIDLSGVSEELVEFLEVRWPSSRLREVTLVDTPGFGGMDEARAARAAELFGMGGDGPNQVDAVIYLMRHMHGDDAAFLEAFSDHSLAQPSPVNAVAVLSRADEIGAGRLDALTSARRIAARYGADRRIRSLVAAVSPVAGLIAETGRSLREDEVTSLTELAGLENREVEPLLLSVDRFRDPGRTSLSVDGRQDLLTRLGMFGLRFSMQAVASGAAATAQALSSLLVDASGINRLMTVLHHQFERRGEMLKARSALSNLKSVAVDLAPSEPETSGRLLDRVEQIEASSDELAELRLSALVLSGEVELDEAERTEVARLLAVGSPAERLGKETTDRQELEALVLERLAAWRRRGAHPLADHTTAEVAAIVARAYESLHRDLESG